MQRKSEVELLDDFRNRCRKHGFKVTPQRVLIYQELIKSSDHPSPEVLFKRIQKRAPNVSLDTVYRALGMFCDMGLVDRVDGFGEVKRFDPNQASHHHVRCSVCHAIMDFENADYDNLAVPQIVQKAYDIKRIRVTIEGLCEKCRQLTYKGR